MDYPWRDADTLRELYHDRKLSQAKIADELDTDVATINKWMQRHGIEARSKSEANRVRYDTDDPWKDEEILRELYVEQRLTQPEIAERLGCGDSTVSNWLERLGVKLPWRDEGLMRDLYLDKGMSQTEIASHLDCGLSTVERWLGNHGIEMRNNGEAISLVMLPESAYEILTDKQELERVYVDEYRSPLEIAEMLSVDPRTAVDHLGRNGIERRAPEDEPGWSEGRAVGYHPYGPNWSTQREKRLEHDGRQCVVCGIDEDEYRDVHERGLDVHHVTPLRKFVRDGDIDHEAANAVTNLITLCRTCHARWEGIELRPVT